VIRAADLDPPEVSRVASLLTTTNDLSLRAAVAEAERRVIREALERADWNRTQAAHLLGIRRRQLFDKIRQFGLHR
jgi:DNA-binding NtrC family response regulator